MTSKSDTMESTTLLNKKTNEESTSLKKYLTPKYAIAATATIALGALGVASQSSSFGRGQLKLGSSNTNTSNNKVVVRQSRLGAGSPQTISLHTGCSPLNKLPFDTSSDWTGKIGAKVVSKSMQSDFRFENAQNLQETSCGNYEGTVDLEVGEEFGFYLYPLGDESDESTVLDNGCLHEGDGRCPAFSSPSALAGIEQCTSKYSDPGSGDVFYNRVFDGETLAYNWGTCETTCANSGPPGCPQISTEPKCSTPRRVRSAAVPATPVTRITIAAGTTRADAVFAKITADGSEIQVLAATRARERPLAIRFGRAERREESVESGYESKRFLSGSVQHEHSKRWRLR